MENENDEYDDVSSENVYYEYCQCSIVFKRAAPFYGIRTYGRRIRLDGTIAPARGHAGRKNNFRKQKRTNCICDLNVF